VDLLSLLEKHLGKSYQSGTEALFLCPFCGHQKNKLKLSINLESHAWKCWVCDRKGFGLVNLFFESKKISALNEMHVHSFILKKKSTHQKTLSKNSIYPKNISHYV
jgi:transcription elongation factor Elf1